jgi:hypothetical protein
MTKAPISDAIVLTMSIVAFAAGLIAVVHDMHALACFVLIEIPPK